MSDTTAAESQAAKRAEWDAWEEAQRREDKARARKESLVNPRRR